MERGDYNIDKYNTSIILGDKYLVKIDGSGRETHRNMRFMRWKVKVMKRS